MSRCTSFDEALGLHQSGRIAEAEEIYRRVLQEEPGHGGALHLLGVVRQQQGDHQGALELNGRAISINPDKAAYHNNYGAALQSLGRYEDAAACFQRALAIRPTYADALANLGMAQAALRNDAEALASFQTALGTEPGHCDALKRLAAVLKRLGRGEEAIRLYETALAECPSVALRAQFRGLTVLTRRWEGRLPTAPEDRLLFDGTHYFTYDVEGSRTSRYQKDDHGNRFDLTAYDWDHRKQLVAVRRWDACGRCSEKVEYARESSSGTEVNAAAAGADDGCPYDGGNYLGEPNRQSTAGKVAFVSPHCVIDFTNGAATATLDGLALLARSGFECQAFCGTLFDAWEEVLVEEMLARRRVQYDVRNMQIGPNHARMIFTSHGQVPVTLFNAASTRGACSSDDETGAFLAACELFLVKNRPDVVWTYGGDPVSVALQQLVRRLRIPILFALHNFAYRDAALFAPTDHVIVPTEFARRFYRETLGLKCSVLPLVMDGERVSVSDTLRVPSAIGTRSVPDTSKYVTFINPEPRKGVHVFARIADVLSRRRPDIPLLLLEGAARANVLAQLGVNLASLKNVTIMPNTPDPGKFYAMTKLILMPSLMENAGFVAMEAMTNGIPVLASNRGGLPETIGDAAPTIDIPARYTPETRDVPTTAEVEPWVETIIRLWDDLAEYDRWRQAARQRAQLWHPDRLAPIYRDFFRSLTHHLDVPREVVT